VRRGDGDQRQVHTGVVVHQQVRRPLRPVASSSHPWQHAGTRSSVEMDLRLAESETESLRRKAEQERRSMQEVARAAIADHVSDRPARLKAAVGRVLTEDAELLSRLAR
jgi:hypothetical protein